MIKRIFLKHKLSPKNISVVLALFFLIAGVISVGFFCKNIQNVVAKQAFKYASYYFNGGAYDLNKAERWYKIALAIQPKLANTHYQLARINFVKGDFNKALAEINAELNSNSENGRSYYIKGLIDGYSGNYQAAIADFKKFTEWSPQEWAGYNDLAWVQYKAKDFKAAEETISSALKKVTPNAFLLNGLGVAKLGQKKYDEAKNIFVSALELAQNLTVKDWQNAYPGNDPAGAKENLEEFKNNLANNAGLADKKLAMGGVFTAACESSTFNNSSCLNISKPASIGVGQQFFANVTMQNTGTKVWNSDGTPHRLGSQNPQDNGRWGLGRVGLPWEPVNPGQSVTFGFTAAAPSTPGTYPFDWKMVEDGIEWFGQTCQSTMDVLPLNDASCLGISSPDSVTVGQSFNASVTMNNNGTKVWNSDATPHRLGSQNPQDNGTWGLGRVGLPWEPVNPTQSVTFNFNAAAPSSPGTYPFAWKMVEDGIEWFGATCQKNINVVLPPCSDPSYPSGSWDRVWCNKDLTGKLADVPDQGVLQFDDNWGGGVVAGIRADDIGFKSGRTVNLSEGFYTFTLGSDDGSRLWVDGSLCIDQWWDQGYTERTCQKSLSAGNHNLRIDWYENGGAARASFRYTFISPPGSFNLSLGGSAACNSVPLSWTAASGAQAYRILRGSPRVDISPYQPYTAQNFSDTTVSQNTSYAYQIEAYNSSGTNRSNEISVTTPYCPPTINLSANPTSIYQGQSVTLTWSSSYVTSCTASGAWSGSKPLNGSQVVVPLPPPSVTYNLQCSGPGGSVSGSTIINIAPLFLPDWKEVIPR